MHSSSCSNTDNHNNIVKCSSPNQQYAHISAIKAFPPPPPIPSLNTSVWPRCKTCRSSKRHQIPAAALPYTFFRPHCQFYSPYHVSMQPKTLNTLNSIRWSSTTCAASLTTAGPSFFCKCRTCPLKNSSVSNISVTVCCLVRQNLVTKLCPMTDSRCREILSVATPIFKYVYGRNKIWKIFKEYSWKRHWKFHVVNLQAISCYAVLGAAQNKHHSQLKDQVYDVEQGRDCSGSQFNPEGWGRLQYRHEIFNNNKKKQMI